MRSRAAQDVLQAVRRRLRLQRLSGAIRFAAWATVAVTLAAVLLHLFLRPASLAALALVVAIPWGAAVLLAAIAGIRDEECAEWADRHLGGACAYATYLEVSDAARGAGATPATQALVEWIEQAAPRSLERLASAPHRSGARKPVAVALVCAALAAVLLQVPLRPDAAGAARSAPASSALPRPGAPAQNQAVAAGAVEEAVSPDAARAARGERSGSEGGGLVPVPDGDEPAAVAETSGARDPDGAAATRAASGGRDAGDSPDTGADAGLSEAWQGAMASTLRSLAEAPQQAARTDPTLAADYEGGAGPGVAARTSATFTPAPAVAPDAVHTVTLGPAEQAYVRAYFAEAGATP